jgi:LAO/AO transport system kinase
VPEGGDGVQVMKAGLNEIADVFVVNKADRDGADRIKAELELSVHLRPTIGWHPPVLLTQASEDVGVDALVEAIGRHDDYLKEHRDAARDAERRSREFAEVLASELDERAERSLAKGGRGENIRAMVERVRDGQINPYSAVRQLIENPQAVVELLRR